MNTDELASRPDLGRKAHIAALIGQYPQISPAEIQEIKDWWNKEASALDVALLSGRTEIAAGYKLFRQDQIDPLPGPIRYIWVIAVGTIAVGLALYFLV